MENIKAILLRYDILDQSAFDEYLELVSKPDDVEYTEKHHICPRSMYPEYNKCDWNIVKLSYYNHVRAHYLLARMYENQEMNWAYSLMMLVEAEDKQRHLFSRAFCGENNPAKRSEVREKISKAKTGISRPDMKGKAYFGASPEAIESGLNAMSKKLKGTVVVKDSEGNRFRVSVDDSRYISGELVAFNFGSTVENSAAKNPEWIKEFVRKRSERYERFATFTFDQMVEFLVDASLSGKNIFAKKGLFARNYSSFVRRTNFDPKTLYKSVVQRLSKETQNVS